MPTEMFLMVLGAALVHATWNALVKTDRDRLALIRVMSLTQLVLSLCLVPFVTVPAPESWPYLAASTVLCTGYMLFLIAPTRWPISALSTRWRGAQRPSSWPSSRSGSWANN